MNRRVSVWKYVKIGDRWRYCKPVYGANNKIKPHWVSWGQRVFSNPRMSLKERERQRMKDGSFLG
jgi:hypothetical protein